MRLSAQDKTRVVVNIYGTQYKLMGNVDTPVTYLQRVATEVDEQMRKIKTGYSHLDMPRIAVLTAVNFADDLFKLQEEYEQGQHLDSKAKKLQEQEVHQLNEENAKLKHNHEHYIELNRTIQQHNEQLQQELQIQQEENRKLQEELTLIQQQSKQESAEDQDVAEKYERLQEEYKKLQTEYNEWIELLEKDKPKQE